MIFWVDWFFFLSFLVLLHRLALHLNSNVMKSNHDFNYYTSDVTDSLCLSIFISLSIDWPRCATELRIMRIWDTISIVSTRWTTICSTIWFDVFSFFLFLSLFHSELHFDFNIVLYFFHFVLSFITVSVLSFVSTKFFLFLLRTIPFGR